MSAAIDNIVQGFTLSETNLRGRIVRLGSVIDDILDAHKYPDVVQQLTGETLVLCALLSSMLKYDGIFTLQAQGKGPVRMLVADMTSGGDVRACAAFKEEDIGNGKGAGLLGEGHMAFTVDQGEFTDRYQGIVALSPDSLIGAIQNYFTQSEQIQTGIMMAVGKVDGRWRGSAIMVQQMPDETALYNADRSNIDEDDWRRTMILLSSVKDEELLSPEISTEDLLYRLFHEEGVAVTEAKALRHACRCNPDRVRRILASMSDEDLADVTVDGTIVMTCEFCSTDYAFAPGEIKRGDDRE